jgi:hypothetical protein
VTSSVSCMRANSLERSSGPASFCQTRRRSPLAVVSSRGFAIHRIIGTSALGLQPVVLHQLQVIERAIDHLHVYLRLKTRDIQAVERLLDGDRDLNRRQLALVSDALRHPGRTYTYTGHARIHRVTHETARSDVSALADRGLLLQQKVGREYRFTPPRDLGERLSQTGGWN